MKRICFFVMAVLVSTGTIGCTSHYTSSIPLTGNMSSQLSNEIAVAGVLNRQGLPGIQSSLSESSTKLLVEKSKVPDMSAKLMYEDILLLLSQPVELVVATPKLHELKQRIGYRYAIVGEQGADPVTELSYWDMGIGIPIPPVLIMFNVPIKLSQQAGVKHATRVLRIVDLEQAEIISEYYALLLDHNDVGAFTEDEIAEGVTTMKIGKE